MSDGVGFIQQMLLWRSGLHLVQKQSQVITPNPTPVARFSGSHFVASPTLVGFCVALGNRPHRKTRHLGSREMRHQTEPGALRGEAVMRF